MTYLFLAVTSCVLTLLLTPLLRDAVGAMGLLDRPDQARKLHQTPVPHLGGLPISLAFFLSILLLHWTPTTLAIYFRTHAGDVYKVFLPSVLILMLGAWDDIRGASPYAKLLVQITAGVWLFVQGLRVEHIWVPGAQTVTFGVFSLPVTVLWVVGITNAFNLVDGLDGLASGVAFFAATTMFVIAVFQKNIVLAILTASLAGATLGFLPFNFNPATVFLGDSGSMFLGFLLASFALVWSAKSSTLVAVAAPLFALGLPIVEVTLSVFRRFVRGQPIMAGDHEHIHHRLLSRGFTPRRAVMVLYGVCAALGIVSLLLSSVETRDVGLILLVLCAAGWMGIQQLGYHEFSEMTGTLRRGLFQQRRIINANVRIRNLNSVFQQASRLSELTATLQEVGTELGFQAIELDLCGKGDALPPDVPQHIRLDCSGQPGETRGRFWRVEIPVGSHDGDNSRIILSRRIEEGQTLYRMTALVEVLSESLPKTLDRLLAAERQISATQAPIDEQSRAARF